MKYVLATVAILLTIGLLAAGHHHYHPEPYYPTPVPTRSGPGYYVTIVFHGDCSPITVPMLQLFYTRNRGYVRAIELREGDVVEYNGCHVVKRVFRSPV
jgi:hypothetical protein